MNLILKIIQGPNTGAEVALLEGVNIKLGRSDECDVVIADQSLPEVACEIEVSAERVLLLLPGGGQERLEPLHVKVFETTAIAIGPGDGPWGELIWPDPDAEPEPEPEPEPEQEKKPEEPFRKLKWALIITLIVVVILEFALWFFWPFFSKKGTQFRDWCQRKYDNWSDAGKLKRAAEPVQRQTLEQLAAAFNVELLRPSRNEQPIIRGNLWKRSERLTLTARAYEIHPGVRLDLSDDETLRTSAEEMLHILTQDYVKVEEAHDRAIVISGRLDNADELKRVEDALRSDVSQLKSIDSSKVRLGPVFSNGGINGAPIATKPSELATRALVPSGTTKKPAAKQAQLPVVGVLFEPCPCLVLQNGMRVLEGAAFNGYIVEKITEEKIILRNGDQMVEWKP